MTEPEPSAAVERPSDQPAPRAVGRGVQGSWWQRNHRRFWLFLAFLVAVTAPLWGSLLLLWLFSPSSPFPKG